MENASILIVQDKNEFIYHFNSEGVTIGRKKTEDVDICIDSPIVSRPHCTIYHDGNTWWYWDRNSTNGSFVNDVHLYGAAGGNPESLKVPLKDGDIIRIDRSFTRDNDYEKGVLIFFSIGKFEEKYERVKVSFDSKSHYNIGRSKDNDIILDSVSVSRHHGEIWAQGDKFFYRDKGSLNKSLRNGVVVDGAVSFNPKDVLLLGNTRVIFSGNNIYYKRRRAGTYLTVKNLTRVVNDAANFGKKKTILNNVSVDIAEGKLVAILGTSGAGKTTFMNCLIGYEEATSGSVIINGVDVYKNKQFLKKQVGYVPQDDLLRGGLSLNSTLQYTGKLRLPKDVTKAERQRRIDDLLTDLELNHNLKNSKIQKLSGGQRKRVSIASELISDPPLLFLDEPTSGLDPETETGLIKLLGRLAHSQGKTLIVVTHTIQNIMMFDEILFFGPGGNLFYSGSPAGAMEKYKVENFVDLYQIVRTHYS